MCDCYTEICNLKIQLSMEKLKSHIYKQLIEKTLDMKLDDRTDHLVNEIVIKRIKHQDEPFKSREQTQQQVYAHSQTNVHSQTHSNTNVQTHSQDDKKKKNREEMIRNVDEKIKSDVKDCFGDFDIDICKVEINNNLETLKDSRNYNQVLTNVRNNRIYYQTELSPEEYIELVKEHIGKLKAVFIEKGFNEKKIQGLYSKFISPLEFRLLKLEGMEKQNIEIEDITKFKLCQKLSANHSKCYKIFDSTSFYNFFLNYSIAFCSVKELIEYIILNPYGFNNIVYIPTQSENIYSFYTLNKIENGNRRHWKMDCRLENLTNELSNGIKNYCIALFREIYNTCFNTNKYIQDYKTKYQILEFDCEQILQNLFLSLDFFKFNNLLKECIKGLCSHTPTTNDKFDLKCDDKEQLQNFKQYTIENNEMIDIVKLLFDDIDDANAKEFYNKFCM